MTNKFKRAVVLGLAAITLFTGVPAKTVKAADNSTIHTTVEKTGKANNLKITYKVDLSKVTITDGQIAVQYDPEVLVLKSDSEKVKFADADVNKEYTSDNLKGISYAFIADAPTSLSGNLMTLKFDVKNAAKAKETVISTRVFGINNDGEDVVAPVVLEDKVTVGRPALSKAKLNGLYQTFLGVYINWAKDNNADGYVIYRSTSKNGKYTKVATVKGMTNYIDWSVNNKTTYYYKVASFQDNEKNRTYSQYSEIKSIKVNKFFGWF